MNKRENLLWQIVLIVGLVAILYNGYKLYNMNNNVIKLWENFEKEEIGTDKKLTDMVERLENSLEERLYSTFEIEPKYIAATSARKQCGIKVPRGQKSKQVVLKHLLETKYFSTKPVRGL